MRNIIKKGYKTKPNDVIYRMKCRTCGCEFLYQLEDIQVGWNLEGSWVYCPDCKYSCDILFKKKYKEKNNGK